MTSINLARVPAFCDALHVNNIQLLRKYFDISTRCKYFSRRLSPDDATTMTMAPHSENLAPPLSSTPTRASTSDALFSSDGLQARASSPPSSPPGFPWEQKPVKPEATRNAEAVTSPSPPPLRPPMPPTNAFSILGKRKPLESVSKNARPKKLAREDDGKRRASSSLTQMRMSLGQTVQKKCKQCGMEYTASDEEDRRLHDKFHKQNTEGVDVGKEFVSKTAKTDLFEGAKDGDAIVSLWCHDSYHRKRKGQAVLEMVQSELGAVPISEENIWDAKHSKMDGDEPMYRAYLYVRGTKCVGFLLAERIQRAKRVVKPRNDPVKSLDKTQEHQPTQGKQTAVQALHARKEAAEKAQQAIKDEIQSADGKPLQLSEKEHPAILGISRIWTSSTHRGQGIARSLLSTTIGHHNKRHAWAQQAREQVLAEITPENETRKRVVDSSFGQLKKLERKEQVAFSQPTDSGARLARRWYGKAYGWSVYLD